jgi:single-strand DNA-binding protein
MNSVNIIGRLVRDPEVKRTDDGLVIANLRFAIDDTFSKEDRADFVNVTVFGHQADICDKYLRKGFMAGATGRIRSDAYTDSEGVKRYPIKLIADRVQILQWPERKERQPEPANEVFAAPEAADAEFEEPAEEGYSTELTATGAEDLSAPEVI